MADTRSNNGLAGIKVMVVDDSKTIRRTAETLLKKVGCLVNTAVDGFDALSEIVDQKPDIIFVDISGYSIVDLFSLDLMFDNPRGKCA